MRNNIQNKEHAFTLAEVLVTLAVIGVVAALTIPQLVKGTSDRELAVGALKFNETLNEAVLLWKQDIACNSDAKTCIDQSRGGVDYDDNIVLFNQLSKFLKINKQIPAGANTEKWLPANIYKYDGTIANSNYGNISQMGVSSGAFSLQDGTSFSVDIDNDSFAIVADINGPKKPNRIGKDILFFTIGKRAGKDIYYYPGWWNNADGLCTIELDTTVCNPDNLNPATGTGASPTAYTILHQAVPDFYP